MEVVAQRLAIRGEEHAPIEHDIALTQDIIFDYVKIGKLSPVLNLNY